MFLDECSEFLHVKPGKGAAFVRTTLRNYVTGNQVEKTFRAGSKVINSSRAVGVCFLFTYMSQKLKSNSCV